MDGNRFKWSEEQLLPNLPQPTAAAMISALIHSAESQNAPTWNSKKCDMQKQLK
jgi:hypothetical protein